MTIALIKTCAPAEQTLCRGAAESIFIVIWTTFRSGVWDAGVIICVKHPVVSRLSGIIFNNRTGPVTNVPGGEFFYLLPLKIKTVIVS